MEGKRTWLQSIKGKLILTMVLIAAVPLAVSIIINYSNSMSTATKEAEEINQKQVDLIEDEFVGLINQNLRSLETLAAAPFVVNFISNSADRDSAVMQNYLLTIDEAFDDGNITLVSDSTGMQIARSSGECVSIADREYFKTVMGGNEAISEMLTAADGSLMVVLAVPVKSNGNVIGCVSRNYSIADLHDFLAEEANESMEMFICEKDGAVIADSQSEISASSAEDNRSNEEFFSKASSADEGTYEATEDGVKKIISYKVEPHTSWIVVVERNLSSAMAGAKKSAVTVVIIGIIMLVVAAFIALFMANGFAAPVLAIDESIAQLAHGHFLPITNEKYIQRKDEFGEVVVSTNEVIEHLSKIVADIKVQAHSVSESSADVSGTANDIAQTADCVAEAVQEIATGATQQADEIQDSTESTMVISENIQKVSTNADELKDTADQMHVNSQKSADQMRRLRSTSEEMIKALDVISEKINATSDAVEVISSKVEAINSIASQTNLLALNASIEAARAGEAGRGFAVVAEEIGQLADNSAQTASEIREEMAILLSSSHSAVEHAGDVKEATEEQKKVLTEAIDSIRELISEIDSTVDGVNTIMESAAVCDDSKGVVVDSMSSLSAISEQNAAASEETSASMQELSATVNTLANTADSLREVSEALIEEISFFKD
ncbi:MAG: methyl-accepting chemotaxis protein [Lachnospiraceae bacterium]|nr:methyl-accepting chemotaxis protein [Lachnospiraceae bacterium]